ncbi:MAG: Na+/H+ antiporter NhaC family protein [Thermoactinomyces sp.]
MKSKGNPWALFPFVIFLTLFIGVGVYTGDFTKMPAIIAVLIASALALLMNRQTSLSDKMKLYYRGAGHPNIIMMVLIFLLSGAFSAIAEGMGAVESTVNLALSVLPPNLVMVGLFVIACFVSLSMGTSMGTIVALAPIGVGISQQTDISLALSMAVVVGGAMFGDNLSFISDTTIAAVSTQNIKMKDKFKTNFLIVLPAALLTAVILFFVTGGDQVNMAAREISWIQTLPYIAVLITALIGINVFAVLVLGIVFAGSIGLWEGSYTWFQLVQKAEEGITGMQSLSILVLLIGGMVELIRSNGGIQFLLDFLTRRTHTGKGAQFSIAGLISVTNLCVANNTISIIMTGPLAKEISTRFGIDSRKTASLLDIFSCSVQGLIPYGPQLLLAASIASISPVSILSYSYYPILIAICAVLSILFRFPRLHAVPAKQEAARISS